MKGEDAGAQIDLLLDRNDGIVNVCEMKWSPEPYALDKNDLAHLVRIQGEVEGKVQAPAAQTKLKKAVSISIAHTVDMPERL